ncbi:hypothetical protein NIES4075_08860 [Tolypothrix sp. NIES-4075]|uniref:hypothetical protein n=1 Tax=Tolypothrix sp. NIES-4075 TaxID=2005459 RepID=UPI000B5C1E56|nr:hypothetical protein [Tolypothrix sp. NIES-4075]GAX39924.1 hypothetical protein NIES4075_08860 [Tolypothrix sp. NIES-4075]
MPTQLTAETLIALSVQERKALISQQASTIDIKNIADEDLHKAYKLTKVIYPIISYYFQHQIEQDKNNSVLELNIQSELIRSKTEKFATDFIAWLTKEFEHKATIDNSPNPRNLFELSGAKLLVTSNSVTRSLSTRMGNLWEQISNISPYVIIPEIEFGIKITGIDIIIFNNDTSYFAQLKTLKGTLTGSQIPRAKKELSIHENPLFVVAFNLGQWTFPQYSKIPRIAGKEFWDKIHIDYDLVESHVKNMLLLIDKTFAELAASEAQK